MTARVEVEWLVTCDRCSLVRREATATAAQRLRNSHNQPGGCPSASRGDNPANYRRRP